MEGNMVSDEPSQLPTNQPISNITLRWRFVAMDQLHHYGTSLVDQFYFVSWAQFLGPKAACQRKIIFNGHMHHLPLQR